MYVAALRVELRIPNVHSLKEKRAVVKGLVNHLTSNFSVSVAEVDHQDLWQRATLGVAVVAAHPGHLDRVVHSIERSLEARPDIEVLETAVSHLEYPE